jgi:hypothetical protein
VESRSPQPQNQNPTPVNTVTPVDDCLRINNGNPCNNHLSTNLIYGGHATAPLQFQGAAIVPTPNDAAPVQAPGNVCRDLDNGYSCTCVEPGFVWVNNKSWDPLNPSNLKFKISEAIQNTKW